jgi:hypothetical protein
MTSTPLQDWRDITEAEVIAMAPIGTRVRIISPVERFPHALVEEGLGTITHNAHKLIGVTLDDHYEGLDEWDNALAWFEEDLLSFLGDVEFVPPA